MNYIGMEVKDGVKSECLVITTRIEYMRILYDLIRKDADLHVWL
jgi:hypothetical protein